MRSLVVIRPRPFSGKERSIEKNKNLIDVANTFLQPGASHEGISSVGNKCLLASYGGASEESLQSLRYNLSVGSVTNLARKPPQLNRLKLNIRIALTPSVKMVVVDKDSTNWGWGGYLVKLQRMHCKTEMSVMCSFCREKRCFNVPTLITQILRP